MMQPVKLLKALERLTMVRRNGLSNDCHAEIAKCTHTLNKLQGKRQVLIHASASMLQHTLVAITAFLYKTQFRTSALSCNGLHPKAWLHNGGRARSCAMLSMSPRQSEAASEDACEATAVKHDPCCQHHKNSNHCEQEQQTHQHLRFPGDHSAEY